MRFFQVEVKADNGFHDIYYVEADNLISQEEMRDYVAQVATVDVICMDDEIEEFEVCDPIELTEAQVFDIIGNVCVRSKLLIAALNNLDNVVLGIYHKEPSYEPDQSEFFIFSAAAGQDADVTAIGKTDENTTREQAIYNGWFDCVSQLKRYWQIPGVVIATGLFTIQTTSEEEYEMERAERELVLIQHLTFFLLLLYNINRKRVRERKTDGRRYYLLC